MAWLHGFYMTGLVVSAPLFSGVAAGWM